LLQWLGEQGARFDDIRFVLGEGGHERAIEARHDIRDGTHILRIPRNCLITTRDVKRSQIGKSINKSRCLVRSQHTWFAAFLLQERSLGDKSRWKCYINSLPKQFPTIPLNFKSDSGLLRLLRGSSSLDKIQAMRKELQREFKELCKHVKEMFEFELHEFIWARTCVLTRIFSIEIKKKEVDALVPLADMLNHCNRPQVSWYFEDETDSFVVTAETQISGNAQIFDSYGKKSQTRFFVNYGFTIDRNHRLNEAAIRVYLRDHDPNCREKIPLLGRGGGGRGRSKKFIVTSSFENRGFQRVMAYCRFVTTPLQQINVSDRIFRPENMAPVSSALEVKALKRLRVAASESLKRFPESLRHDHRLLKLVLTPKYIHTESGVSILNLFDRIGFLALTIATVC